MTRDHGAESEQLGNRYYGPRFPNGNGNGTAAKMLWAAAGFAFMIVVLLVGSWMSSMNTTVSTLSTQLAQTEAHLEFLQREFDRLGK